MNKPLITSETLRSEVEIMVTQALLKRCERLAAAVRASAKLLSENLGFQVLPEGVNLEMSVRDFIKVSGHEEHVIEKSINDPFEEHKQAIMRKIAEVYEITLKERAELAAEMRAKMEFVDIAMLRADEVDYAQRDAVLEMILSHSNPTIILEELWASDEFNRIFGTDGTAFERVKKLDEKQVIFKKWAIEKGLFDLLMELILTHTKPVKMLESLWGTGEFNRVFHDEGEALGRAKKLDKNLSAFKPWAREKGLSQLVEKLGERESFIKPPTKDLKVAKK